MQTVNIVVPDEGDTEGWKAFVAQLDQLYAEAGVR